MVKNFFLWLAVAVLAGVSSGRAQEVVNTNHTVVRFDISTGGLPFGSLDIELFDQEKPETVQNFLRYVYRGAYSNLVIHRLVQNFVLQGGNIIVTNPADTGAFSSYTEGPNYGPITNEYSVGPELSNVFGTIAMARFDGVTNSASGNWFFNLADNPGLDAVDGGFTVFGRVVNTTGSLTGTNLLNHFNTVPVAAAFIASTPLIELPVSGTNLPAARYADLFTLNARIISGPQLPAPQHSVVRFHINTGGTNFGLLDIELFDQEKPETVKNFLLYVHSGIYSNLVVNRLVPGFVLQAGRVRLRDPNTNVPFSSYVQAVNWGPITNEYGVGPELGNDYGTLAMARIGGVTNSASGEFFFNLTNNSSLLDTNDGGFTVFGRVINTYDPFSGTNLLNYFNTFTNGRGVGAAFTSDPFDYLQELAMSTNRSTVLVPDLFTIQSAVIQGVTVRDATPPITTVTQPVATNGVPFTTTNATIRFAGTGGDNQALHRVFVNGPQGRIVADGLTNWSADVRLDPGTNTFLVFGIDEFGNQSTVQTLKIFYSVKLPVTLQFEGKGKTLGITNGQIMEVGVTYPLTATPSPGYFFVNWRGSVLDSYSRLVYFTMESNATVLCRFSRNLLGLSPGRYDGVFYSATNGLRTTAGLISLTLRPNGFYSGQLRPLGANYGIRGIFGANGSTHIRGPLGTNTINLIMGLYAEGVEAIDARYLDGNIEINFRDGTFLSDAALWRQQTYGRTNPYPLAGRYTFQLSPPALTNNALTDGFGFGSLTVDTLGRVKWSATLANQVVRNRAGALVNLPPLKGTATVLKGDRWSFHFPSRAGEALVGDARFFTNGTFNADTKWFSPGLTGQLNYVKLNGARYTPPVSGPPFNWTNGVLTISGAGLTNPIVTAVAWQTNGSFLISSNPHNVQLFVTNATGFVGGSFNHPTSNTLTRLRGVVLQSSNSAAGFVPHLPKHGGFELKRAP